MCSELIFFRDVLFDCHEVSENMLLEESKIVNNVVHILEEDCKEDFVAAQHCKYIHEQEDQPQARQLQGLLCFYHG